MCSVAQLCPTLCNPLLFGPPGSSICGIFQARVLEWVAISCSRGSSWPRDQACVASITYIVGRFFTAEPLGKPIYMWNCLFFWEKCTNKLKKGVFSLGYFQMDLSGYIFKEKKISKTIIKILKHKWICRRNVGTYFSRKAVKNLSNYDVKAYHYLQNKFKLNWISS